MAEKILNTDSPLATSLTKDYRFTVSGQATPTSHNTVTFGKIVDDLGDIPDGFCVLDATATIKQAQIPNLSTDKSILPAEIPPIAGEIEGGDSATVAVQKIINTTNNLSSGKADKQSVSAGSFGSPTTSAVITVTPQGTISAVSEESIIITGDNTYAVASEAAMLALVVSVGDIAVRSDINKTFRLRVAGPSVLGNWTEISSATGDNTYAVASEAAMLALVASVGDIAVRSDTSKTFRLRVAGPSVLGNWTEISSASTGAVASVYGRSGSVVAMAGDYGTNKVTEESNLYFTGSRAVSAITGQLIAPSSIEISGGQGFIGPAYDKDIQIGSESATAEYSAVRISSSNNAARQDCAGFAVDTVTGVGTAYLRDIKAYGAEPVTFRGTPSFPDGIALASIELSGGQGSIGPAIENPSNLQIGAQSATASYSAVRLRSSNNAGGQDCAAFAVDASTGVGTAYLNEIKPYGENPVTFRGRPFFPNGIQVDNGISSTSVIVPVDLGDAANPNLLTTNKTILGSINEIYSSSALHSTRYLSAVIPEMTAGYTAIGTITFAPFTTEIFSYSMTVVNDDAARLVYKLRNSTTNSIDYWVSNLDPSLTGGVYIYITVTGR